MLQRLFDGKAPSQVVPVRSAAQLFVQVRGALEHLVAQSGTIDVERRTRGPHLRRSPPAQGRPPP